MSCRPAAFRRVGGIRMDAAVQCARSACRALVLLSGPRCARSRCHSRITVTRSCWRNWLGMGQSCGLPCCQLRTTQLSLTSGVASARRNRCRSQPPPAAGPRRLL
ncbi:hypothetical protein N5T17_05030 [Escherichia coli]|nr:hypothetical protein [Escherichia coli]MCW3458183.1 hypothetical protein [Escherichia coli]